MASPDEIRQNVSDAFLRFMTRRPDDGRAVEHWAVRDDLGLAMQAGLLPAPS
jgi:hypothetical protein